MVEVQIKVSNKELDNLENLIVAWNLCNKHKTIFNATEEQIFEFTRKCKACIKINKKTHNSSLHLWCKLVTAYEKAIKKK